MRKKAKNSALISWAIPLFAAACGIISFFMIFAESIVFPSALLGNASYTGLQTAFGYTVNGIKLFTGSAGISLAYIFPLVAAAVAVIGKGNKICAILSSALFLTGGILAFCATSLLSGNYVGTPSLGAGAIVCGVLSFVGGTAECASLLLK